MSLTLRTTLGCTEAVIDDDGGLKRFYQVASILSDSLHLNFDSKEDEVDTIDWEFNYQGQLLTLHYNIYTGVSIFPAKTREALKKANKLVVDLANTIAEKLLNQEPKRNIA